MNALAVVGVALLALIVGVIVGVRLASRRYERLLSEMIGDLALIIRDVGDER